MTRCLRKAAPSRQALKASANFSPQSSATAIGCSTVRLFKLAPFILCSLVNACGKSAPDNSANGSPTPSSAAPSPSGAAVEPTQPALLIERDADHVGGVITRVPGTDSVYIADEDHGLVRFVADTSPLRPAKADPTTATATPAKQPTVVVVPSARTQSSAAAKPYATTIKSVGTPPAAEAPTKKLAQGETTVTQEVLAMGGAPANLVAIRDGALVTVRDPGKLVRVQKDAEGKLTIKHELAVAADAWGIAINEQGTRALVTSAWTNTVTLVEISDSGLKKCAEVSVPREPRGVVFASDSLAYVNHLVGNQLSRLSISSACETNAVTEVKSVVVPPSPARSPIGKILPASMGYSLALAPDNKRLFVPRHALGARSHSSWFGTSSVDVLLLPGETPAAPMHEANMPGKSSTHLDQWGTKYEYDNQPVEAWSAFTQPRDIRYRRSLKTVLVVSEGGDRLVELDAMAMDPANAIAALYELSDGVRRSKQPKEPTQGLWPDGWRRESYASPSDANVQDNHSCAAPQGAVLDSKESTALVFCRASTTIVAVPLQKKLDDGEDNLAVLHFATLDKDTSGLNFGRRLYYSSVMAEGMGCAGCHPEGRDDGHVWEEIDFGDGVGKRFFGGPDILGRPKMKRGVPRRTPMLVGRVLPVGRYGWRAESETLEERIRDGSVLHAFEHPRMMPPYYSDSLGVFLRKGLVKPPARTAPLTPQEQKGKTIFEDQKTQCTVCHEPTRYFSNYTAMKLDPLPTLPGFLPETDALFKTPSLLYVGNHGSLYHDGSAKDLDDLIQRNGNRMGKTAHLTTEERSALVAYLKTL